MSFDPETVCKVIARLRRPPFNRSTQEIGDLTPKQLADIFTQDDDSHSHSNPSDLSQLMGGDMSQIPAQVRPTIQPR